VGNAENNEQIDADILQCRADILRARDIVTPYKKETRQEPKSQKIGENTTQAQAEQIKTAKDTSVGPEETEQKKTEIPRFDLAEKIMAEQRRITAVRRKAPGKKTAAHPAHRGWAGAQGQEPEVESIGYTIGRPTPALSEQERIITEIVARDIERLCRRDYLADSR